MGEEEEEGDNARKGGRDRKCAARKRKEECPDGPREKLGLGTATTTTTKGPTTNLRSSNCFTDALGQERQKEEIDGLKEKGGIREEGSDDG